MLDLIFLNMEDRKNMWSYLKENEKKDFSEIRRITKLEIYQKKKKTNNVSSLNFYVSSSKFLDAFTRLALFE